jgi:hypothetical protein
MELGPPEEPIRGEVEAPSGERTAFSGWIGLFATIEAARMRTPVEGQPIAGGAGSPRQRPDKRRMGQWSRPEVRKMNPRGWIDERVPGLI